MKRLMFLTPILLALAMLMLGCGETQNPVQFPDSEATNTALGKPNSNVIKLDMDLTVTATYLIPDGYTLDGNGHTITAIDPAGGHFVGPVVSNDGATAHVKNLTVNASGLTNVCDGGADRLRGIMFEGASGSITHCTVIGINQGASGCQEGNAIEVRNAPFDGTHPNTQTVEVAHNKIIDYQKTGIVANGDVNVSIHHNWVGASATQENLAANSIQLGFGAMGEAVQNNVHGNQWKGTSDFAASAVLVYLASSVNASQNNIRGNSDVGLFVISDDGTYDNNRVFDEGPDHMNSGYDIGAGNYGLQNAFTNNKVRGFETPYEGETDGTNKAIPGPMKY